MSLGSFPIGDAIARLKTKVQLLRLVGNAADLATAIDNPPAAMPAAFVLGTERGDKPAGASGGVLIQQVHAALQVVLFVRNVSQAASGSGARGDMDALSLQVDAALLNWTPGGAHDPCWFQSARDEQFKGGVLIHQRVYGSRHRNQVDRNP